MMSHTHTTHTHIHILTSDGEAIVVDVGEKHCGTKDRRTERTREKNRLTYPWSYRIPCCSTYLLADAHHARAG